MFGLPNGVIVHETAVVERFSAEASWVAGATIGIEKRVPDVWLPFLNNFVNQNGLKPVDQALKPSWTKAQRAMYIRLNFDSLTGLKGDPEFLEVNRPYAAMLPGSAS